MPRPFDEPFEQFHAWLAEAQASEPSNPTAMSLATADAEGRPSCRMVLLKGTEGGGFVFYTNTESHKGRDLAANPHAALCFHWKSLDRQVRVEGPVEPVSEAEADAYFASRARGSRIGAWASQQSRPLADRRTLKRAVAHYGFRFGVGAIPRPPHWSGYRVLPERIEFWTDRAFRLHDRFLYTREGEGWAVERLYP